MIHTLFLEALNASLKNEAVSWEQPLEASQWEALFSLARIHKVLPMVFDAVSLCPAAKLAGSAFFTPIRQEVRLQVMHQTQRTAAFRELYVHLQSKGLTPMVVKGIVCRSLYPRPDLRSSADEDLLIPEDQFPRYHEAMVEWGMYASDAAGNPDSYEVPYRKEGSPLFIELHKALFPRESEAYGHWNRYFTHAHSRSRMLEVQDVSLRMMEPTQHMFYLILHAFKHFLHSGFGIRQICDIALYGNAYGPEIDWAQIYSWCKDLRAEKFAAALLKIAREHLTFSPEKACLSACWLQLEVNEKPLLSDILEGGVYGGATLSRKHSSTMTLKAASGSSKGLCASLFPSAEALQGKYPYLKQHPVLLPVAWGSRILNYGREVLRRGDSSALDAVAIGNSRIQLLRVYGIID